MSESLRGEAVSGKVPSDILTSVECPTCGRDDFQSNRGMRRHHAMVHDESLSEIEFECDRCGDNFTRPIAWIKKDKGIGGYCSPECRDIDVDVGVKNREERVCDGCGDTFETTPSSEKRFCSLECVYGNRDVDERDTKECAICGDDFPTGGQSKSDRRKTCSKECGGIYKSIHYTGEDSPTWKGGRPDYYGQRWKKQRRKARERDNHECVICGKGENETGRKPDVHHVTPVIEYEDPNDAHGLINLVTLCREHHSQWEGLYLRPDTRGKA